MSFTRQRPLDHLAVAALNSASRDDARATAAATKAARHAEQRAKAQELDAARLAAKAEQEARALLDDPKSPLTSAEASFLRRDLTDTARLARLDAAATGQLILAFITGANAVLSFAGVL